MGETNRRAWIRNSMKGRISMIVSYLNSLISGDYLTKDELKAVEESRDNLKGLIQKGVWKDYNDFINIKRNEAEQ